MSPESLKDKEYDIGELYALHAEGEFLESCEKLLARAIECYDQGQGRLTFGPVLTRKNGLSLLTLFYFEYDQRRKMKGLSRVAVIASRKGTPLGLRYLNLTSELGGQDLAAGGNIVTRLRGEGLMRILEEGVEQCLQHISSRYHRNIQWFVLDSNVIQIKKMEKDLDRLRKISEKNLGRKELKDTSEGYREKLEHLEALIKEKGREHDRWLVRYGEGGDGGIFLEEETEPNLRRKDHLS